MSILCLVLGALVCLFLLRYRRTQSILRELVDSMERKKRFMPSADDKQLKALGLLPLIRSCNELSDRYNDYAEQSSGFTDQVNGTLGAVQEAVIIFSSEHIIEFANRSAEELFKQRKGLKGSRIESALRSTSLLELLGDFSKEGSSKLAQVSLEQGGELLWFEASCAKVTGLVAPHSQSTLLVLHDITKLKQLEMMRRDFVANVSHELRTPLTIIKGFAETLIDDEASISAESRTRFLGKILTNAERLHILVEDLLTLSRLESKPDQIDPQLHSLEQMLNDTADNYRSRLNSKAQSLTVDFDPQIKEFYFDRFRLNQVLDNLIENAFRYATDFKEIKLEAKLLQAEVHCAVIDDGPGIPAKDVPHVFERFYRVDKGRSRDRGGTGLGLSITKHIIQLHGGKIYAESDTGKGTAIRFTLPYLCAEVDVQSQS